MMNRVAPLLIVMTLLGACAVDRDRNAAIIEGAQDSAAKGVILGALGGGAAAAAGAGGSATGNVLTGIAIGGGAGAAYGAFSGPAGSRLVLGPENWLAFDALGRCRHDKAIRIAEGQLTSDNRDHRVAARLLLAIAHQETRERDKAQSYLQQAAAEPGRAGGLDRARQDVSRLERSLDRQRRAEQVSISCNS